MDDIDHIESLNDPELMEQQDFIEKINKIEGEENKNKYIKKINQLKMNKGKKKFKNWLKSMGYTEDEINDV